MTFAVISPTWLRGPVPVASPWSWPGRYRLGLRVCIWRLRLVFRGPLFGKRRQRLFLAGHALDSDRIDGDDIDPREKPLGSFCLWLAVFFHQGLTEALLGFPVVNDPCPAEQAYASIGEARVAFEPAIVKDTFPFIDHKANAAIPFDVRTQMSSCARGVQIHFPVDLGVQERDAIWETIIAHRCEMAAIALCQRLTRTFIGHGPVCATDLR